MDFREMLLAQTWRDFFRLSGFKPASSRAWSRSSAVLSFLPWTALPFFFSSACKMQREVHRREKSSRHPHSPDQPRIGEGAFVAFVAGRDIVEKERVLQCCNTQATHGEPAMLWDAFRSSHSLTRSTPRTSLASSSALFGLGFAVAGGV